MAAKVAVSRILPLGGNTQQASTSKAVVNEVQLPQLELLGLPISPFVRKNIVVLEYKKLNYKFTPIHPYKEKTKLAEYNPLCKIPVLLVDGKPTTESEDINLYLDALSPMPTVYPSTSKLYQPSKGPMRWLSKNIAKAKNSTELEVTAEELSRRIDKKYGPVFGGIFFQRVALPSIGGKTGERLLKDLEEDAHEILEQLELDLDKKKHYFLGKTFSVVDIGYGTWLRQAQLGGFEIDSQAYPNIAAYLARVYSFPAFKKAILWENRDATISLIKDNFTADFTRPMIE